MHQGYYGSLEAFLRKVNKTKVVSYHLKEVFEPIKCLSFYSVITKKVFYRPLLVHQGYYCSLEASLRQVKKTKVVSYHLKEVLVPIKCLGFYRVTTKKVFYRP